MRSISSSIIEWGIVFLKVQGVDLDKKVAVLLFIKSFCCSGKITFSNLLLWWQEMWVWMKRKASIVANLKGGFFFSSVSNMVVCLIAAYNKTLIVKADAIINTTFNN